MKKLLTIALLLSTVNLANGATWGDMFQQYLGGQPVASATATATSQSASLVDQLKASLPELIENIKTLAPKAKELAAKAAESQASGGMFSGISGWFARAAELGGDKAAQNAVTGLASQLPNITDTAKKLLDSADPATQSLVKGLLAKVVEIPEFKTLLQYATSIPIIGGQLQGLLNLITKEASTTNITQ